MSDTASFLAGRGEIPGDVYSQLHPEKKMRKHIVCEWKKCRVYGSGCTIDRDGIGVCDIFRDALDELSRYNFNVFADLIICKYCKGENGAHLRVNCPNRFMLGGIIR